MTDALIDETIAALIRYTIIAGIIGGVINFLIERSKIEEKKPKEMWLLALKWLLYGVGAAAAVPAYLAFTESEWLDKVFNDAKEIRSQYALIYASLCVVVAIFPTAFLNNMINRINTVEKQNEILKEKVATLTGLKSKPSDAGSELSKKE